MMPTAVLNVYTLQSTCSTILVNLYLQVTQNILRILCTFDVLDVCNDRTEKFIFNNSVISNNI